MNTRTSVVPVAVKVIRAARYDDRSPQTLRHCQLGGQVSDEAWRTRDGGTADYAVTLTPLMSPRMLNPSRFGSSVVGSGDVGSTKMEEIVDLVAGREKAFSLAGRLEPRHPPLPPSSMWDRLVPIG